MKWPVRNLLNPVSTRTLLFGTDPFDTEYVLQKIDSINIMSGKMIKEVWFREWEQKATKYIDFAGKSESKGNIISAEKYYMLAAQCYYASYMINTDDINQKKTVYKKLASNYRKSVSLRKNKVEYIEIETENGKLPGYIHFPDDGKSSDKYPCVVTYSGFGSCKEELDMLALPLTERGLAVLTVDMPGTGDALFDYNKKCIGDQIDCAIESIYAYLSSRNDIDFSRIANFGLCMGGGYAFRASAKMKNTKCCVSLFPLFINICEIDSVPVWMKRGKWAAYQHGYDECDPNDLVDRMKVLNEGTVDCDFFLIHSADDNWMTTDASLSLLEKANGYKESLEVTDKPAYVSEETIMHAMPVGEQFHWVKHIAADFIAERLLDR
ncbi:MAG: alpha/beta hydrolase family protein [Oscillospiraceae bacterium]|nr:alpha/beta hydrolase [Oscillospiraceae bacterium]